MSAKPQKTPTILLVDDSEDNLDILSMLLSKLDCAIVKASSGEEALEIVDKQVPALLLLDVSMPGIDGFEVCRRLKEDPRTRSITILFVSALGDLESRVRGLKVGGVDFISKPFEIDEVLARVSTQLELYGLRQELIERNQQLESLALEKDRFLDLAAHGLRHPLLHIRGLIGLLRSGQVEEQGREKLVSTIAQASEQMNHILNGLLDFSRLGKATDHLEEVSVKAILEKSVSIWQHRANSKRLQLEVHLEDVPKVYYDRVKITQILETVLAQAVANAESKSRLIVGLKTGSDSFVFSVSRPVSDQVSSLEVEFGELLEGPKSEGQKANSQAVSLSIVAKLIKHFSGSTAISTSDNGIESLEVKMPLRITEV